jgi:hypothetical protein
MKKLLKLIFHSRLARQLRITFGFHPPTFILPYGGQFLASDLFIWRTDDSFETIFKASDILKKFYEIKSNLHVLFFDHTGEFLCSKDISFHDNIAQFVIVADYVGRVGYGTFCVFNIPLEISQSSISVTNRCYVGFGKNGAFSMIHGNLNAFMITDPYISLESLIEHIRPAVSSHKSSFKYYVQKKPSSAGTTEYWFANPLSRDIAVEVEGQVINIKPYGCGFVTFFNDSAEEPRCINSDFCFARPILINETNGFIDCHHG